MPGPCIHMSSMRHAGLRLARGRYEVRASDRIDPKWTGLDTKRVGDLLPSPQHFLLWMPLRLERHHDRENPPLIVANFDNYRGPVRDRPDPIFVPGYVEQTAGLLPMLHDLETVEVWRLDTDGPAQRI